MRPLQSDWHHPPSPTWPRVFSLRHEICFQSEQLHCRSTAHTSGWKCFSSTQSPCNVLTFFLQKCEILEKSIGIFFPLREDSYMEIFLSQLLILYSCLHQLPNYAFSSQIPPRRRTLIPTKWPSCFLFTCI